LTDKALTSVIHGALEEEESPDSKAWHSSKLRDIEDLEGPDPAETLTKRLRKVKINVAMEFADSSDPPVLWENVNGRLEDSASKSVLE
uniref:DUF4378 domain-containing protein n=1 Tax=Rodentolepis nana TaxID=102285 RepID=A0A0R3TFV2_RODNA